MYTILLPTDGSDFANKTLKQALSFANALQARVIALHVEPEFRMPRDEGDFLPASSRLKQRVDDEHRSHAQTVLVNVEVAAEAARVDCESVVAMNHSVYEAIVATADERNCDLIIMASHGHAGVTGLLLGSVTAKVLTHTKLPVLVLH